MSLIRLSGKVRNISHSVYCGPTPPNCLPNGDHEAEIELPPLSRKPEEGDAILLKAEVLGINESKDFYEVFIKCKTFADKPYFKLDDVVAILLKEEKECSCPAQSMPVKASLYQSNCPIHCNQTATSSEQIHAGLLEALGCGRTFPQRQEKKMEWCEHLTWKYSNTACKGRWFFKRPLNYSDAIADDWVLCPLCGAKRPDANSTWTNHANHASKVEGCHLCNRPDASTETKTELPLKRLHSYENNPALSILYESVNKIIDYLKWKESHDQHL